MERIPCGKTHKYLVNREHRCFCPSNVVTKWRVLTSRVAFVWCSKIFSAGLPKNLIAFVWGSHLALSIGGKVMAQSRIPSSDFCVWNLPILCLIFSKNIDSWKWKILFSKIVPQRGFSNKLSEVLIFLAWPEIVDIYSDGLLRLSWLYYLPIPHLLSFWCFQSSFQRVSYSFVFKKILFKFFAWFFSSMSFKPKTY